MTSGSVCSKATFELLTFLNLPPKCWDGRRMPPHPGFKRKEGADGQSEAAFGPSFVSIDNKSFQLEMLRMLRNMATSKIQLSA